MLQLFHIDSDFRQEERKEATMEDLKIIFAQNVISLRKNSRITQAELAEAINYSDKAVSKWERGESIPDVYVLTSIAKFFGVTIDYLVTEHNDKEIAAEQTAYAKRMSSRNHLYISFITVAAMFVVALIAFVVLQSVSPTSYNAVFCFVYPLPVIALVCFIFSAIWGKRAHMFTLMSLFLWLLILVVFLILSHYAKCSPLVFLIGIPAELITMLSFKIIRLKKK